MGHDLARSTELTKMRAAISLEGWKRRPRCSSSTTGNYQSRRDCDRAGQHAAASWLDAG